MKKTEINCVSNVGNATVLIIMGCCFQYFGLNNDHMKETTGKVGKSYSTLPFTTKGWRKPTTFPTLNIKQFQVLWFLISFPFWFVLYYCNFIFILPSITRKNRYRTVAKSC